MRRDFSEESKQKMLNLVVQVEKEKFCNFSDWVGDKWYAFQDWIGVLDIKHYIDDVNAYHKKVIDKNNATEQAIIDIFDAVRATDHDYAEKISQTRLALEKWNRYIEQLTEIVNPLKGKFTVEYMGQNLGALLNEAIVATNDVEEKTIDEESPAELVDRMLEIAKGLLKIDIDDSTKDIGDLTASLLTYLKKFAKLVDGDAENGLIFSSEALELGSSSVDLWKKLAELLEYFYELKKIPGVEEVGTLGELCGLLAAILEVAGKDYASVGEQVGEAMKKIGGSIVDVGVAIYKVLEKGTTAAVSIYAGIAKAILASYGQFIKSLEEYGEDGDFDLGDVGETGVDVAVEGLAALISTVTLGIISENTTGITTEEVREKFKDKADQYGKDAAEYILNNPKLRERYKNATGAERAMIIAYAFVVTSSSSYQVLERHYTGDPDDIAKQIAIDKLNHIPSDYQWEGATLCVIEDKKESE